MLKSAQPLISLRKFWRNEQGNALIEGVFTIMFLSIAMFGVVDVGRLLETKDIVTQASNSTANVLSSLPMINMDPAELGCTSTEIREGLQAGAFVAYPDSVKTSARFCYGADNFQSGEYSMITTTQPGGTGPVKRMQCGVGLAYNAATADIMNGQIQANCNDAVTVNGTPTSVFTGVPTMQYVVVESGCEFIPLFNFFGFLSGTDAESNRRGIPITTISYAPMRYDHSWPLPTTPGCGWQDSVS